MNQYLPAIDFTLTSVLGLIVVIHAIMAVLGFIPTKSITVQMMTKGNTTAFLLRMQQYSFNRRIISSAIQIVIALAIGFLYLPIVLVITQLISETHLYALLRYSRKSNVPTNSL